MLANQSQAVNMVSAYNGNGWSGLNQNQRAAHFIRMLYCFFRGDEFSMFHHNGEEVTYEILQQNNCIFNKMPYIGIKFGGWYYLRKNLVFKFIKEMSDMTLVSINAPKDVYFQDLLDSGIIEHGFGLNNLQGVPMPDVEYFTISEDTMEKIINPSKPLQYD
jgi:hypothetical protein